MNSIAIWTMVIGVLTSVACSLVGCFLVLRRMSLLGDAISHAVLPGIATGFLLSGRISGPLIVLGAMFMGIVTAFFTQALSRAVRVSEDASLGVVFTTLFALGVIMIETSARSVDLDAGCVLYGSIEMAPFDTTEFMGYEIPSSVVTLGFTLLIVLGAVLIAWKELKIASFDPELASSLGYSARWLHYFLMTLTAGVTVAAFESVGSILVVAMLIVPAATAQLLTDQLRTMVLVAALLATMATITGYLGAVQLNTSVPGMMAVAAGMLFLVAFFFAPRYGLVARLVKQLKLSLRIFREDVLGALYRAEEISKRGLTYETLLPYPTWLLRWLTVASLEWQKMIVMKENMYTLTDSGRERAVHLIRAHRLWETYLQKNVALPSDHLHAPAEKMEHYVGPELLDSLAKDLKQPTKDPHGRAIPVENLNNAG